VKYNLKSGAFPDGYSISRCNQIWIYQASWGGLMMEKITL